MIVKYEKGVETLIIFFWAFKILKNEILLKTKIISIQRNTKSAPPLFSQN
jgi:hypothetical protein